MNFPVVYWLARNCVSPHFNRYVYGEVILLLSDFGVPTIDKSNMVIVQATPWVELGPWLCAGSLLSVWASSHWFPHKTSDPQIDGQIDFRSSLRWRFTLPFKNSFSEPIRGHARLGFPPLTTNICVELIQCQVNCFVGLTRSLWDYLCRSKVITHVDPRGRSANSMWKALLVLSEKNSRKVKGRSFRCQNNANHNGRTGPSLILFLLKCHMFSPGSKKKSGAMPAKQAANEHGTSCCNISGVAFMTCSILASICLTS